MRRSWSVLLVAVVLGAGVATLAPASRAQTELEGFVISATGDAVNIVYEQPSLGLPFSPVFDGGLVRSLSTMSAGPTGYGLSSVFWPGSAAADGGPQVGFPAYPIRAETFYPQGPAEAAYTDFPQMTMRSQAKEAGSGATTSMDGFGIPSVMTAARVASAAASRVDQGHAVAEAVAGLSQVSIFNGQITFDAITTNAKATSDGEKPVLSGVSTVVGLRIAGNPATVDSQGVNIGGQKPPAGPATVNDIGKLVLGQAGMTLRLVGADDSVVGAAGSRTIGGLLLRISGRALAAVLASVPPALSEQLAPYLKYDSSLTIVFAGVSVSASASEADLLDFGEETEIGSIDTGDLGLVDTGTGGDLPLGLPANSDTTVSTTASAPRPSGGGDAVPVQRALANRPVATAGVPFALIVLALLGAVFAARGLRLVGDRLLAVAPTGERCPLEHPGERP